MTQVQDFIDKNRLYLLIFICFVQSSLLIFILKFGTFEELFKKSIFWLPCVSSIILIPTALQLTLKNILKKPLWQFILIFLIISVITGSYASVSMVDGQKNNFEVLYFIFITFLGFMFLPLINMRIENINFLNSYNNFYYFFSLYFIQLFKIVLYLILFFIIIFTCSELFKLIAIDIFKHFTSSSKIILFNIILSLFVYLTTPQINKFNKEHSSFFLILLLIISLMAISFLITLGFTGLEPLWKTSRASVIIICLILIIISCLNAVYKNGEKVAIYNKKLINFIKISICTMPIYCFIAIYSLYIRIMDSGFSVHRIWGFAVILLISIISFGYSVMCFRNKDKFPTLGKINLIAIYFAIFTTILMFSPILDPNRLSAFSQVDRLLNNKVAYNKFDYDYLNNSLGKSGKIELAKLVNVRDKDHLHAKDIRKKARNVLLNRK